MTREELKNELKNLKKNLGVTYAFLAKQCNVNRNNISYFITIIIFSLWFNINALASGRR